MKPEVNYYKFEEAQELKQTFSSWINKTAHIGNGRQDVLKRTIITPRRIQNVLKKEKFYIVKFEFTNNNKVDAHSFLMNNGLGQSSYITKTNTGV